MISFIGIDADECEHRYDHQLRAVVHIKPSGERQRATLDQLGHDSLDAYVANVSDRCGWDDLAYGQNIIVRALEGLDA